jgi:ribonuclease HI
MVEVSSDYIIHVEIVDKRQVGLVSNNMEKEGLKKSLKKLQEDLNVVELVTDASSSIKKLLGWFNIYFSYVIVYMSMSLKPYL